MGAITIGFALMGDLMILPAMVSWFGTKKSRSSQRFRPQFAGNREADLQIEPSFFRPAKLLQFAFCGQATVAVPYGWHVAFMMAIIGGRSLNPEGIAGIRVGLSLYPLAKSEVKWHLFRHALMVLWP